VKTFSLALLFLLLVFGCSTTPPATPVKQSAPPLPPAPSTFHPMLVTPQALGPAGAGSPAQAQVLLTRQTNPPPAVALAWDPSADPLVVGYHVYFGNASGAYTNVIDAGNATSLSISNLAFGATYFFAGTCYTASGIESVYSTEATYAAPGLPLPPGNFRLQASFASAAGGPWLADTNWPPLLVTNPLGNQFWRLQAVRLAP
jgi:hypothetical protein